MDFANGGFAISTDNGKTWDCKYSSGLPENSTPIKMALVYPENEDDVTIYVATLNNGFYVSKNSGKTFTAMNDGIERVKYKEADERYHYILAADIEVKDGRIFGMTARSAYNNSEQPGKVYEFKNNKWEEIKLPENVMIPRDIYYHKGTLYISSTPIKIYDYKNGTDFSNYGGGILAYKDGKFERILDETIGGTGVAFDYKDIKYVIYFNGNIYRKECNGELIKIYDSYHSISKGIELSDDNTLYMASLGGGVLRLEGLQNLRAILLGDVDGNGEIDINDLARLKLHIIEKINLDDESKKRADLDENGKISINDLAKLKRILLNFNNV